ncbi:hypothetical protein J4410_06605 [Candidatus Woesearchaeota archaeon]|nr:hypothetical protein [Candidatus Woesearchaeota archaeon]
MITCKTKKWGNSLGFIIPKEEVLKLDLGEDQEIAVDIIKKTNPLKELFRFSKSNKITKEDMLSTRKLLENHRK